MERTKTLTMNWDALPADNSDDDDHFFDLASSGSDDDEEEDFQDPRMSLASNFSAMSTTEFRNYPVAAAAANAMSADYDVWMTAPGSIKERRKRLLQGMGLAAEKELIRISSKSLTHVASKSDKPKNVVNGQDSSIINTTNRSITNNNGSSTDENTKVAVQPPLSSPPTPLPVVLVRSRSDSEIETLSTNKKRKEDLLGMVSKQRLTRTSSTILISQLSQICKDSVREVSAKGRRGGVAGRSVVHGGALTSILSSGAFFLIRNLDTGKEFIVNEYDQDGKWNRVSDLQTGKQLTLEEFEKCVGHSPVVKELMRRENVSRMNGDGGGSENEGNDRKTPGANSYISKSLRMSKRRGAALLKNIKSGVAHSMSMSGLKGSTDNNKEKDQTPPNKSNSPSSGWIKVRQSGKSYKELSAVHLCQEIQAHQGSIWTIKFSMDARFLASGGEDKSIHIWEVQECGVTPLQEGGAGELAPMPSEKNKKKKKKASSKKGNPIPEYVHVPETVFSLSEKPICSFEGHLDDVLDLSWSRSQLLLSSSMDKTVRLWDMETKSCLKLFAHNDYVTCIQFNPIDDNYFISGSLDAKVRIWSIPDRQLVDWTDLHEMVTAVCYTPDGQGALIGSHKGSCRMYSAQDCKLNQEFHLEIQNKKRSQAKKITGFQFSAGNPSEVLVTSADSRIRILDGTEVVHKFRGFRNLNSQISASFSLDGKYVICASEDSQVYAWKLEEHRIGKSKSNMVTTRSHESFQCRDVSVAIPWPGTVKGDPPPIHTHSKRNSKRASHPSSSTCSSPSKEDTPGNSKRSSDENGCKLPPLPKKNNNNVAAAAADKALTPSDEESGMISHSNSSVGESFTSNSSLSLRYGDSPSISAGGSTPSSSWSYSWSWFDGNGHGNNTTTQATAWGLVIVTATLGGEIRAYQNFGLPRRIGRQTNLF